MTNENTLKMRGLAIMAAAGYFLTMGTPAQACNGQMQPNLNSALAPMARLLNPAVKAPPVQPALKQEGDEPKQAAKPGIVGLWDTTFLQNGVVIDEGYEVWHSDGTEILIDIAPPATDNVCIGTWVQTGALTYSLTHPSWTFDMNGNLTGTAMILTAITISHDGNSFSGNVAVKTFDVNGVSTGIVKGQVSGQRIGAQ